LLTRIYGPAEFGALGLFTSLLSVAAVASGLQYELSIVSASDEAEAEYLTLAAMVFAFPASMVAGGVCGLLIRFSILGFGGLSWSTPLLLTLAMCFVGVFAALRYWCLREEQFGRVSQAVVVQSAARVILQTVFGVAGSHAGGLLAGETAGRCLGMSRIVRSAWPALRRRLANFRWKELTEALWRNRNFPLYSLPSSLLDSLCMGLTIPLLTRLYGPSVGGHYSLVWRAISVPSVLITGAVADTFHSRLAICAQQTPARVMALFNRTAGSLLLLGVVPASILWFWGEPLFRWVFGVQWALAGAMASLVAPWYLAQFVVSPVSRAVFVLSGQKTKLAWDVLYLGSLLATFSIARSRGMAPLEAIRVLAVVSTALFIVYFLLLIFIIVQFSSRQSARNLIPELLPERPGE
jgi:O-antigen/teichoic acid export membrane protein